MPKRATSDTNSRAYKTVQEFLQRQEPKPEKNPAAVALGRLGGLKGGKARALLLSREERRNIARQAAIARWEKNRRDS